MVEFLLLSHIHIYHIYIYHILYIYVCLYYVYIYILYVHANDCQGKVSAVESLKEGEKRKKGRWRERNKEWGKRSLDERK